jgi:hypothetical protein
MPVRADAFSYRSLQELIDFPWVVSAVGVDPVRSYGDEIDYAVRYL